MFNVFSVFNNAVRVLFNGEWHDKTEAGKVVPDTANIDIQIEGHINSSQFESSKLGSSGQITGKALAALATKVAEGRGFKSNLVIESDDAVYTVVSKKIASKPVLLRHATNKQGQPVTYVSLRYNKPQAPPVACDI